MGIKYIKTIFLSVLFLQILSAQNPVRWSYSCNHIENDQYEIVFKAEIEKGWHVYSMYLPSEDGPVATSINYDTKNHSLVGKATENVTKADHKKTGYDETFDMQLTKYKYEFSIVQRIQISNPQKPVSGYLTYMTCNDKTCLPPTDVEFSFIFANNCPNTKSSSIEKKGKDSLATVSTEKEGIDSTELTITESTSTQDDSKQSGFQIKREKIQKTLALAKKNVSCTSDDIQSNMSLFTIFIFGFLGGLFALLTPCVFPMVPLTVSYFTKKSKNKSLGFRNALIYSFSIIFIYVTLGMSITIIFGDNALNWLSTHWIPNTLFFVLFVAFAISFFGYYDIKLPSSWSNKTDTAADKGGLLGIFFMAFTLSLVSFSCTGPIIGTLLVQAAEGGRLAPAVGMFGFSFALALPFGLFSAFPGWLNSLPKSGGWMNTVKVVLGFVELALAFKFLSKADLTMHWGILKYETYLLVTLLCALFMGIYLLGFILFPHDDKGEKISFIRKIAGSLSIGLAIYLGFGFTTNTKTSTYNTPFLMSGIAPPACYSYFKPCDCPAGIQQCFKDYEEGLAYAKSVNKPIMIDFTGHGCENCRKMEDNVWVNEEINQHLNEDYVIISLYVDDRKKLDKIELAPDGTKIRNIGNKWAAFEKFNFEQASQPLYVLMSPDETVLNEPKGYTPDAELYKKFLQCGLDEFEKLKK